LEAERPLLLVIDTLLAATRASGDGVGRVKAEYDELLALEKAAVRQGSAVLIVTHTAKAERSFSLDRVLGTTGVTAAVDSVITLLPGGDSGLVVLESRARDYAPMELNLRWADGWIVESDKQSSHKVQLLALLDTGPKTTEDLSSVLGLSPRKVRKMLNEMVAEGTIRKTGIAYWRVAEVMEGDQNESGDR
jgi:predicted Rossmann fold nucleotide-binding protein DprA/Smf involved in DNA uptake